MVRAPLIQSELTPHPRSSGSSGTVQAALESLSMGAPAQPPLRERVPWPRPAASSVPSANGGKPCSPGLILELKQAITPLTRGPGNAKRAVILSWH